MFSRFALSRTALPFLILAAALAPSLSCSRRQAPHTGPLRLALLRFENLSGDPAADWMGRALPELITAQVEADHAIYAISAQRLHSLNGTLGARPIQSPGISSERPPALALRADRLGYGEYYFAGGRLVARLTLEDAATGKVAQVLTASAPPAEVAALAGSLARQITGRAAAPALPPSGALKLYSQASESATLAEAAAQLEGAIAAAPDYGPPYRLLAELKARTRDTAGGVRLLQTALARGPALGAMERARLELALGALRGDSAARRRAAAALTGLEPQDPTNWQTLAELASGQQDYLAASQAFRKVTELEPDDWNALNQLGYALAWSGDLPGAVEALRRYQAVRPGDPNAVDSLGDVHLIHGKLAEAEKLYLENAHKNPAFLNGADFMKAAMARLMAGDTAGAGRLAGEYADSRTKAQDPSVGFYRAEWSWVSGKRKAACAEIERFAQSVEATPARELASRAFAQLAIWQLMLGERETARLTASRAYRLAGPGTAAVAGIALFLSQPSASAAEWTARVDRFLPNAPEGSLKNAVLGYALLLEKDFRGAAAALGGYAGLSISAADVAPALSLAWAQIESGQPEKAEAAVRLNPVPPPNGLGSVAGFYFPRIYYLRAVLAQKQGKTEEAQANFRRFLELSGPDPLQWGEEAKAKAAL